MVKPVAGLSELAGRYVALLCDVWGVIHNGREAFPGPCAALARWRAKIGPVILISNSPRPSWVVLDQLDGLGAPRDAYSKLVTSGDVTRTLLAKRAPGPVYAIGPERDGPLYEGLGLTFCGLEGAAFICCTGPRDDDVETPEDYREELTRAAKLERPMICANPDKVVQRGERLIYCGGALAELYEALGGEVIMAGKPHAPIYQACLAQAAAIAGRALGKGEVLAVGDGIATDLVGAGAQGLDALFIAGGIHAAETLDSAGALDLAAASALLAAAGQDARYVMADLAW
jgi:HAD superfamily hydrolase (TIGR01459 family)